MFTYISIMCVPVIKLFTARKWNLGHGNVFTTVCHSVHRGSLSLACITGHMTGGLCSGGLCPEGSLSGSLSGGSLSRGVSVWGKGVSVQGEGGLCPGGILSRGISVQGESLSKSSLSRGWSLSGGLGPRRVSVRETPIQ